MSFQIMKELQKENGNEFDSIYQKSIDLLSSK
jgi:hypothetical protein